MTFHRATMLRVALSAAMAPLVLAASPNAVPTPREALGAGCGAPSGAVPGTYTSFLAGGVVTGSHFTQSEGFFSVYRYAPGSQGSMPETKPHSAPIPEDRTTSRPRRYAIFTGTYEIPSFTTVAKGDADAPDSDASPPPGPAIVVSRTRGCAFVIATLDGKPSDEGSADNANGGGNPTFARAVTAAAVTQGEATVRLTFTATGASGTIELPAGVRGTIALTSRREATFGDTATMLRRLQPPTPTRR